MAWGCYDVVHRGWDRSGVGKVQARKQRLDIYRVFAENRKQAAKVVSLHLAEFVEVGDELFAQQIQNGHAIRDGLFRVEEEPGPYRDGLSLCTMNLRTIIKEVDE